MDEKIKILIQTFGEHRVKLNQPLADHVFSKLGGPAKAFFIVLSQKEFKDILDAVFNLKVPYLILGNGTKTFISPQGFSGVVIKNRTSGLKIGAVKGKVGRAGIGVEEAMVEADSGVSLGKLNEFLLTQKLQPLDNVSLNSTIGGCLWTNSTLAQVTQKVVIWQRGEILEIGLDEIKRNEDVILAVVLKIKSAF